jgi:hypothetical protein
MSSLPPEELDDFIAYIEDMENDYNWKEVKREIKEREEIRDIIFPGAPKDKKKGKNEKKNDDNCIEFAEGRLVCGSWR